MELSVPYYAWLQSFQSEPGAVVAWAAFGTPLVMLAGTLPSWLMRKLGFKFHQRLQFAFYSSLAITWIISFLVTITLLMIGISAIHMLLCWLAMWIFYFVFCFLYQKPISKWMDSVAPKSKSMP